jgi:hypothetical protein
MPKNEPSRTQGSRKKNAIEVSAETEDLLHQVISVSNCNGPDEALRLALRYYLDSQSGVELNPELTASLDNALKTSKNGETLSAQEARNRIHYWILQSSSQTIQ